MINFGFFDVLASGTHHSENTLGTAGTPFTTEIGLIIQSTPRDPRLGVQTCWSGQALVTPHKLSFSPCRPWHILVVCQRVRLRCKAHHDLEPASCRYALWSWTLLGRQDRLLTLVWEIGSPDPSLDPVHQSALRARRSIAQPAFASHDVKVQKGQVQATSSGMTPSLCLFHIKLHGRLSDILYLCSSQALLSYFANHRLSTSKNIEQSIFPHGNTLRSSSLPTKLPARWCLGGLRLRFSLRRMLPPSKRCMHEWLQRRKSQTSQLRQRPISGRHRERLPRRFAMVHLSKHRPYLYGLLHLRSLRAKWLSHAGSSSGEAFDR